MPTLDYLPLIKSLPLAPIKVTLRSVPSRSHFAVVIEGRQPFGFALGKKLTKDFF
ncbi:MAG: hypothetical protein JGK24_05545 [Microcoleus sp. PH2017_29_MFU_D_A]|uniref:hypothetical protein n=1 Tax=unclassified Microcoleus TaxID=2642155 RepID=UPI001DA82450|nr:MULTISPECIES: hypothetical protein [unclassified Microcoleus]MCC3465297.1 hypothetical protein [Microcoleus sp. PH2017_06_SFM_O_A]MCC3503897.1 hypothetical protein [Microcoleus sp. PH2017_19_SFW_U_A]MCC3510277.1 hypothetical protein [Microcoleus sp. PH2017_17_BER_D_A]MCC3570772.1 hypothetical protein [Microcoleus sp. PH2017_34_RAT_O_A]MCC3412146.1 hypothetical protein [Microcoleus sp. PH2017_02_FOX_O_A]